MPEDAQGLWKGLPLEGRDQRLAVVLEVCPGYLRADNGIPRSAQLSLDALARGVCVGLAKV